MRNHPCGVITSLIFLLALVSGACAKTSHAAPPEAPAQLSIGARNPFHMEANGPRFHQAKKLTLWWSTVSGATSYKIYRGSRSQGEAPTPIVSNVTATTYTDTGLGDAATYYYQITACNSEGESSRSMEASETTKAPPKIQIATDPCPWVGDSVIRTAAWLTTNVTSEDYHLACSVSSIGTPPAKAVIDNSESRIESPSNHRTKVGFARAGVYRFAVKVTDGDGLVGRAEVSVDVKPVPTTIAVTPSAATLHLGESRKFRGEAKDQFGVPIVPAPKLIWSVPQGETTIDPASGVLTAAIYIPGPAQSSTSVTAMDPISQAKETITVLIQDRGPVLVKPAAIANCNSEGVVVTAASTRITSQFGRLSALATHDSGEKALLYRWELVKAPANAYPRYDPWGKSPIVRFDQDGDYTFEVAISDQNRLNISSKIDFSVHRAAPAPP